MEHLQEYLIANQIIQLCENGNYATSTYQYKNEKIEASGHKIEDAINYLLSLNVNPLALLEDNNNNKFLLINKVIESSMSHKIIENFVNKITAEQLNNIPYAEQIKLIKNLADEDYEDYAEHLFKIGFRVNPGETEMCFECEMALAGKVKIFELISEYQPEFNFEKKYNFAGEELTILELLTEEIDSLDNSYKSKKESCIETLVFIKNLLKIKHFNDLSENLSQKDITVTRNKV